MYVCINICMNVLYEMIYLYFNYIKNDNFINNFCVLVLLTFFGCFLKNFYCQPLSFFTSIKRNKFDCIGRHIHI